MENNNNTINNLEKPLSLKEWMITLLVLSIPIVGFVMVFIWAFSDNNTSKKTYCQALILYVVIFSVICTILAFTLGASLFTALSGTLNQNQQLTQEVQQNMELSEKIIDAGINQDPSIVNDYLKEQNKTLTSDSEFLVDFSKLVDEKRTLLSEELVELNGEPRHIAEVDADYLPFPAYTYYYNESTYDIMDNYIIRADYTKNFKFPWDSGQNLDEFLLLFNLAPSEDTESYEADIASEGNIVKISFPKVVDSDFTLFLIVIQYDDIEKTVISNIYFNFYNLT